MGDSRRRNPLLRNAFLPLFLLRELRRFRLSAGSDGVIISVIVWQQLRHWLVLAARTESRGQPQKARGEQRVDASRSQRHGRPEPASCHTSPPVAVEPEEERRGGQREGGHAPVFVCVWEKKWRKVWFASDDVKNLDVGVKIGDRNK